MSFTILDHYKGFVSNSFIKNDMALTINPTLLAQNKTLAPGVSINFTF